MEIERSTFGPPFFSGTFLAADDEDELNALVQGGVGEKGGRLDMDSLHIFEAGKAFDTF
jgi:hypothetical protein